MQLQLNDYETVFILTPVLSEEEVHTTVDKFKKLLQAEKAEIIREAKMGLKDLAYPIQGKSTGIYHQFEFKAPPTVPSILEREYRREEKIIRFLTLALDKHGVAYNAQQAAAETAPKEEAHEEKALEKATPKEKATCL